jgi:Uma2 family endonuclease
MVVEIRYHSAEELWELSHTPEYADMRLELSQGELIVMSPVSWKHGTAAAKILRGRAAFAEARNLGEVTGAETGYILFTDENGRDTVRAGRKLCGGCARARRTAR